MWHIEKDPILRSTILAVAIFDRPPDWPRLRARIERATCRHPAAAPARALAAVPHRAAALGGRADVRPRLPPAPPAAPAAGRRARRCSTRCNRSRRASFDRARPLWEFTLFEGLEGDRAALAMKVHHSITDGVGGMALLAELVDLEREPRARRRARPARPCPRPTHSARLRSCATRSRTPAGGCSASRAASPVRVTSERVSARARSGRRGGERRGAPRARSAGCSRRRRHRCRR